ncbi:MAG: hypothetical protein AAGC55_22530, partial [Myxococcota bacterium]
EFIEKPKSWLKVSRLRLLPEWGADPTPWQAYLATRDEPCVVVDEFALEVLYLSTERGYAGALGASAHGDRDRDPVEFAIARAVQRGHLERASDDELLRLMWGEQ